MTNTITKITYDGQDYIVGGGDVVGPASSTDGHLAVFDGATGKLIKDGGSVPTSFAPGNTGTTGQVLTKTNDGYEYANAPVTSVNSNTGAVTVSEFSPSGTATTGYVVTKTADGYEWAAPSGGDVMVSSQTGNILTTGMKIRAGEETDYANLGVYDSNTLYLTIPDQS